MAALYIHIPFCHSKCAYCDFFSTPDTAGVHAVIDAIGRECALRLPEMQGSPFVTAYIGGGTPSILSAEMFTALIKPIKPLLADVVEFTIEANPEDVNPDKVALWRDRGVNRVSIGVQSLCDAELRGVGRRHDAAAAIKAIETVACGGISNISADVIFGLPGQSLHSLALTLRTLLELPVTHISAYCLMYEPGTRLYAMRQRGVIADTDDDVIDQMYRLVCDITADAGFDHYEISNYARPGCASRHNSAYWTGIPYLGLGPAAHSFDGSVRRYNPSSIKRYLAADNPAIVDPETPAERLNDVIMTRLRTAAGLPLNAIDPAFFNEVLTAAQPHISTGNLILSDDNRLYIPKAQWLIADTIIRDLFVVADD